MRILLLGTAAIALSGCSWLGSSGHHGTYESSNHGYYAGGGEAKADDCCERLSKWNLEGAIGPEYFVGGDAITGDKINVLPGVVTTSTKQSMKDAYDPGMRYELGGSYALNPNRKLTLMGSYAQADGERVNLGTIGANTLTGDMDDYERYGVEAGLRQYFRIRRAPIVKSVRPYVEGKLGASKVKSIGLTNATLGGAAFNGGNVALYRGGWVPTAAGMVGLETPLTKRSTIGVETGIRYTGVMRTDKTDLGPGVPLAGTNNGTENWSVPIMLRGRYRF